MPTMRLKHCCAIGRNVQAPSPVVPDTGFPKIGGKNIPKKWMIFVMEIPSKMG